MLCELIKFRHGCLLSLYLQGLASVSIEMKKGSMDEMYIFYE